MVTTRSKKIKFDDEPNQSGEYYTAEDEEEVGEEEEEEVSDSDSDSDSDDAPEEESTATTKTAILQQQAKQHQIKQDQKKLEKEKRRQLDMRNKQQQDLKKQNNPLPEYLPTDLLGEVDEEEEDITLKKVDSFEQMKKSSVLKIKKQLDKLKDTRITKGPVQVQIYKVNKHKTVPKAESKIINTRDQWLQRKSVRRK